MTVFLFSIVRICHFYCHLKMYLDGGQCICDKILGTFLKDGRRMMVKISMVGAGEMAQ